MQLILTQLGKAKLARALNKACNAGAVGVSKYIDTTFKNKYIKNSPTHAQEKTLISADTTGRATSTGGRFLKEKGFVFFRDAVRQEKPTISGRAGDKLVKWGNIDRINRLSGFGWRTQWKGQNRRSEWRDTSTSRFSWNMVRIWEDGAQFRVIPRGVAYKFRTSKGVEKSLIQKNLHPAPGWMTKSVDKRIPNFRMMLHSTTNPVLWKKLSSIVKQSSK